jgi:hypothetical protein
MRTAPPADFVFPAGATAPLANHLDRAIAVDASWPDLLPYAAALDSYVDTPAASTPALNLAPPRRPAVLPVERWLATFRYPRWSGDVVVVGECGRDAEIELMARLIDALLRSGRTVLYLSVYGREHAALRRRHHEAGWSHGCTLARLATGGIHRQFALHVNAPQQLWRDWTRLQPLFAATRARWHASALAAIRQVALAKTMWRILTPRLRFRVALTRTNYRPLSAAVLAACRTTAQLSISLQHSIITCPASFTPLVPKRYLCFGEISRAVLAGLEAQSALPAGVARCELLAAGAFTDPLPDTLAERAPATIVIADQTSAWATRYFGGERAAREALRDIVPALAASPAIRRIVVRLHPSGDSQAVWEPIAARWPGRVEVRGGDRPLAADLAGAAAVIGLFSTVLPTAAAAAVPTFFLWQPGWYSTPDLAPFVASQFVDPASLPTRLEALLRDPSVFAAEQAAARAAAARYYRGGGICDFSPAFLDAMLAPLSASPAALSRT